MKELEFKNWFESGKVRNIKSKKTVQNRISNCKKVEHYYLDLDTEYKNDNGKRIMNLLTYSMSDFKNSIQPKHNIKFNGNIYNGTATLKQSVNLYFIFCNYLHRNIVVSEDSKREIQRIESNSSLTEEEKRVLVKYRIGQSEFRKRLMNYWEECCSITNCDFKEILIASHIKPWSISSEMEKYDVFNGLLLTPNYDKLFDKNLISFDENGVIIISDKLSINNLKELNILKTARIKVDKLTTYHIDYLKQHSEHLK